jgi:hypothetical protein
MRWQFYCGSERSTYASGTASPSVLSLAFLTWLDGREVNKISRRDELAGFLANHSDLTRRELAGLLGTFYFDSSADESELHFKYENEPIRIVQEISVPRVE